MSKTNPNSNSLSDFQSGSTADSYVQLDEFQVLRLTGKDSQNWLHNFCTADIKALENGSGCEAFILNIKGKTLAHGIVLKSAYELTLLLLGTPSESIMEHLEKYVITEDVRIEDLSADHFLCFAVGPAANELLDTKHELATDLTHHLVRDQTICIATRITSNRDWLLLGTTPRLPLQNWLEEHALGKGDLSAFESARIDVAWPMNGVDVNTDHLPQEFRRDKQAISFNKGCYLGQETVARIDAMGHVNQFFTKLSLDGIHNAHGTELKLDEKKIGTITSCAAAGSKTRCLGFVKRSLATTGKTLESSFGPVHVV